MQLTFVFLYVVVQLLSSTGCLTTRYWDYVIVGGGPSGLQMGYFLKQANRDYVVFERSNISGNFFSIYPRHDRIISINKRHTGQTNKEFNFRHDWNSLISHDESLKFKYYSKDYYPNRFQMLRYLADYERKLAINVMHNTDISDIQRVYNQSEAAYQFSMRDQHGNHYLCKTLIAAVGLWKANEPNFEGKEYTEGYDTMSLDPEDYEGQSVLILGRGNTAFEVADSIYGSTSFIHMMARSRVRLSWSTHYVGDLRAVNNALLDNYQLKSLDGVLEAPMEDVKIVKRNNKLYLEMAGEDTDIMDSFDNFALRDPYDKVIRCLGFSFDDSAFNNQTKPSRGKGRKQKFPKIDFSYQSEDFPGLYFVGGASHSLDLRKSAGGFIHGYRYTSRTLHRMLEWKNHGVPWPSRVFDIDNLLPYALKRVNEASGLYQMFSMLCDVIAIRNDSQQFEYFEEFPCNLIQDFYGYSGREVESVVVLVMEYGANYSGPGKDIFRLDRATGEPAEAHKSNFLHPVYYYYKKLPTSVDMSARKSWEVLPRPDRIHHVVEDFLTFWMSPLSHVLPLRRFFEYIIDQDLRNFFGENCFYLSMTHKEVPVMCNDYLEGQGLMQMDSIVLSSHVSTEIPI